MPTIVNQAALNKLQFRMQQVLQYRTMTNLSDAKIAERVGLSASGLNTLLKMPEYLAMEEDAMAGKVSQLEERLAGDEEARRQEFKYAVPAALTALVETVRQKRDLRARLVAAKEILDRDPSGQFVGSAKLTNNNGAQGGPSLPSEIVAALNAEGNRTVTQIRSATVTTTTKVEPVNGPLPEGHDA